MASSSLDEYRIPKLSAENYYAWNIRARAALVQKKLWDAIDPGYGVTMSQDEKEKNERALTFLFLIVEDSFLDDIGEETRAKKAWEILKEMHTSRGLLHKLTMLKEFVQIEKTASETMKDYITRFTEKQRQMQICGFGFNEKETAGLLLAGLPQRYEMFVTSNFSQDGDDLEMRTVKSKLLMEEKRISHQDNMKEEEKETVQALRIRHCNRNNREERRKEEVKTNKKRVSTAQRKGYVKCYTCNQFGHIARECPQYHKFKKEDTSKSNEKEERANIVIHQALICTKSFKGEQFTWFLDSGATDHMSSQRSKFIHFEEYESLVEVANGGSMAVKGIGSMIITLAKEYGGLTFEIKRILYVPELGGNLLSVGKLAEKGLKTNFQGEYSIIVNEEKAELIRAKKENGLYTFYEASHQAHVAIKKETQLWHKRLGHLHIEAVRKVEKDKKLTIEMKDESDEEQLEDCPTCVEAKMRRKKFPKGEARKSSEPLELVHSDIVGKINPKSRGGANYFITFIDDYSRYTVVYFIKAKNEALDAFKKFKNMAETQLQAKIKCLRTDNGGEYTSEEFNEYLAQEGIIRQLTVPYTPQQNGVAERMNQTLVNTARCMILESGVPTNFWADAVNSACYVRNKCPSKSISENIPVELWTGKETSVDELRVFGSKAWAVVNEIKRKGKFEAKAKECVMIGYSNETKGYKLWNWKENYVFLSRDVKFDENAFPLKEERKGYKEQRLHEKEEELTLYIENESSLEMERNDTVNHKRSKETDHDRPEGSNEPNAELGSLSLFEDISDVNYNIDRTELPLPEIHANERRSQRIAAKNDFKMTCALTSINETLDNTPITVEEALSGNEAQHWKEAMKGEIENLKKSDTWELVKRPKDKTVIGSKWVYRKKFDEQGNLKRYKARLVAQGFTQVKGIDFNETFCPVIKMKSLRMLISLTIELEWDNVHIDVVSAYINSELSEPVYMEQPEGFIEKNTGWVLKVKRALYGLHQSGREWNMKLDGFLKEIGLIRSAADPCVYFDPDEEIIIGVYVDDIVGIGRTGELSKFVKKLEEKFEIKNLGKVTHLLSMRVDRSNPEYITLDQTKYAENVLKTFGMSECKGVSTPLDLGTNLSNQKGDDEKTQHPYRQLIGSLLYLTSGTRPDLAFAVNYLSQFNDCASDEHWNAAKHVLRYLNGTKDMKIVYTKTTEKIAVFADSDWGSDKSDRKSWSGYVVKFAGSVISWKSKKQRTVALSTVEAEYIGMCEAAKEALWWKHFLEEIGLPYLIPQPIDIKVDNQGAIAMAKRWETSERSKHIDLRYHFLRQLIDEEKLSLSYIASEENLADMFTKRLSGKRMKNHLQKLNIV